MGGTATFSSPQTCPSRRLRLCLMGTWEPRAREASVVAAVASAWRAGWGAISRRGLGAEG